MGHIFCPVYQPRQYGCIHVIHTFTKKNPHRETYAQKTMLGVITSDKYPRK